jgi:hypothetical protein
MSKTKPRGIRNNNPGNIEKGDPWQGLANPADDGRFCIFIEPTFGIRAIARILVSYQDRHGINTIRAAINRWAPPVENDTEAYVQHVAKKCGVGADEFVSFHDFNIVRPLVEAIILHENGQQPYTDAQITKGLVLAGIEPKAHDSLSGSRTVKGSQVVAAGGAASLVAGIVEQAEPAMPFLQTAMLYAPWVVGGLVLIGVAYIVWARIDDRRKGLR